MQKVLYPLHETEQIEATKNKTRAQICVPVVIFAIIGLSCLIISILFKNLSTKVGSLFFLHKDFSVIYLIFFRKLFDIFKAVYYAH